MQFKKTNPEGHEIWRQPLPEPIETRTVKNPAGTSGDSDVALAERMARLEGAFEGVKLSIDALRHSQNLTVALVSIVFAAVVGFGIYTLQRIDSLPSEFQEINRTLSQAITAARSAPPQVILMPAPVAPATPPAATPSPTVPAEPSAKPKVPARVP